MEENRKCLNLILTSIKAVLLSTNMVLEVLYGAEIFQSDITPCFQLKLSQFQMLSKTAFWQKVSKNVAPVLEPILVNPEVHRTFWQKVSENMAPTLQPLQMIHESKSGEICDRTKWFLQILCFWYDYYWVLCLIKYSFHIHCVVWVFF